jgi:hypothetical protein
VRPVRRLTAWRVSSERLGAQLLLVGLVVAAGAVAHAQGPAAAIPGGGATAMPSSTTAGAGGAAAGTAAPGAPSGMPGDVASPGFRLGSSEVAIVGGNVASARERAVTEALKQAVGQAITAIAPEAPTQPKTVAQILGKVRVFVRRYRSLQEGEVGASRYGVKLEAEVDEAAVRRAFERGALPAATVPPTAAPSYFVVAGGVLEGTDAVIKALVGAGLRTERAPAVAWDQPRALEAGSRAGLSTVAFVNATATPEGEVRGVGVEAVSCTIALRLVAAGTGAAVAEDTQTVRAFSTRTDEARRDCFARAAAAVLPHAVPQGSAVRGAPDLRTVTVEVDVVEPGAVQPLLKQLRGSGSVSAVDVRRIVPGRVELQVRSRMTAPALVALLGRDTSGAVAFSAAEAAGDLVRVRARLREEVSPPGAVPLPAPGASSAPPLGVPRPDGAL